jgi:death-on-curing protein
MLSAHWRSKNVFLLERDVLAVHGPLLALHGGLSGLRDRALLESGLARPQQHHSYSEKVDIIEMAALYTSGIVQDHPFVGGSKTAGFFGRRDVS